MSAEEEQLGFCVSDAETGEVLPMEEVVALADSMARQYGLGDAYCGVCVLSAYTPQERRVELSPLTLDNLKACGIVFGAGDWVLLRKR